MGLFDFLKPKETPAAPAPAPPKTVEPYLGDLAKTGALYQLMAMPDESRDEA